MGVGEIPALHEMEFVPYNAYPYQYNQYNDTTYYYYESPMVEMVDSMGMMSMSPVSTGSMSPTSAPGLYIPDHNNNDNNNTAVLTPEGESEYPFIDLPYIHNGKSSFNSGGKKPQKGFKKGFKAYKDFSKDKLDDTEESTVKLVPPE